MRDLAAAVYMDALAASNRDIDETLRILEGAREELQRLRGPNEPAQEVLPHAADIERMAPQGWKRKDRHTRFFDDSDDPYSL